MITIIARKHLRYDTQGNDIARVYISVSSSSELPAQDGIQKIIIAEASKAWDVSTGDKYGFVVGQGWKKQATVINPMTLKGRVDSIEDLPYNAEPGWVYFVGDPEEENLPEYMYTEDGKWDPIGTNSVQIDIDAALSTTSENPVQNKVITEALNGLGALAHKDSASTTFTPTLTTSVSNGALTVSFSQDTITVT